MNAYTEETNPQSGSLTPGTVPDVTADADVFPDFTISLEEAGRRIRMLKEFVREHMVDGEDYGVIPGTSAKPTPVPSNSSS